MEFNLEMIAAYLQTQGMEWGINIVTALAVFFIGKWIAKRLVKVSEQLMEKSNVDSTLKSFIGNVLYGLALALIAITAIGQLGVETTSLAAVLAAAGLAIGLSLQGSLSNLASGVMIILFRPFKEGDFIEAGGTSGTVDEVSIFTTTFKTPDNKKIIVPNGAIIGGTITNYSAHDTRRIDFTFGVGYNDDLQKVKSVLQELVENEPRILKDPTPTIAVAELADSSVNLVVRPWVKSSDYWGVFFDLTEAVKLRFDAEGISIPFPQQDVHIQSADVLSLTKAA